MPWNFVVRIKHNIIYSALSFPMLLWSAKVEEHPECFNFPCKGVLRQKICLLSRCIPMQGASRRMVAIAEACYANDFGCSLDQLGLCEMITENQEWDSGALLVSAQLVEWRLPGWRPDSRPHSAKAKLLSIL